MSVALRWKNKPLFRLLAFLDNVGLQNFTPGDMNEDGEFTDKAALFRPDHVCHTVLRHSLEVFEENIKAYFENEDEMNALLTVSRAIKEDLLSPASVVSLEEAFSDAMPGALLARIQLILQIEEENSLSDSPFVEQYLIDGVDRYLSTLVTGEVDRLIQSCGVAPNVLEGVRGLAQPALLNNFLLDVIFPTKDIMETNENNTVVDWLIASFQKNRETVDVEEVPSKESSSTSAPPETTLKRKRPDDEVLDLKKTNLAVEEGDLLVTAENVDKLMMENPSALPKSVVKEKRKDWVNPSITQFELENHYTAKELQGVVQEIASLTCTPHPISDKLRQRAKKAKRKAEFCSIILDMHQEQKENDEALKNS